MPNGLLSKQEFQPVPDAILYEDEDIMAINKPPGWLVIPDRWDKEKPSLYRLLNAQTTGAPRFFVVHRLDRETSGLVIFAKNAPAHRALCRQFTERQVRKVYETIVEGESDYEFGKIDRPVQAHPKKKGRMIVTKTGKPSITEYEVIERFDRFTHLKVYPKTGRTHQIRIHLAAVGLPIAVDALYGKRKALYLSDIQNALRQEGEPPLIDRVALHASELRLAHPTAKTEMSLQAELPDDMKKVLNALREFRAI
jgi:23S rRNA pseudouridine955/2504/2580 synthase/23S rRNA pseudouridine1911/1915/1917 synthase